MNKTKFYELLLSAKTNPNDFNRLLKIMEPLIKKTSHVVDFDRNVDYYDEDLESTLIMEVWKYISNIDFLEKLAE